MQVINYSEFRAELKSNMDMVAIENDIVIVNRPKNNNVVLLSLKEYNAMQETLHLLSSPKNRQRLEEAIERDKIGTFETHSLMEN